MDRVIGHLSSDSGIALVVPGYFVCAGILIYTGIVAAILGMYRGRAPLHLAFAATCVLSAAITFSLASYYLATSVQGAVDALRWSSAASAAFIWALVVFVGLYTEARGMRTTYWVTGMLAVVFAGATFALPYGTRYAELHTFGWIHMPWGESLFHVDGTIGAWNHAIRLASVVAL